MELADLRTFVTVAEEGSFSRAATRLCRTQPAVSVAVRRLEEMLGEQLFSREGKRPALTEAGRVLLTYASRLFELHEEARASLADLRCLRRGDLTIGANESLTPALLPFLDAFRRAHPGIRVDVKRVRSRDMVASLARGVIDCGALGFKPEMSQVDALPVIHDELVVLVPPSHRLAATRDVSLAALTDEVFIAHSEPSQTRSRVLNVIARRGMTLHVGLALPTVDAIKRAVERAMGVAFLPRSCATTELRQGRLCAVSVSDLRLVRQVWIVSSTLRAPSHAAASFLALIGDAVREVEQRSIKAVPKPQRRGFTRPAFSATMGRQSVQASLRPSSGHAQLR